MLSQRTECEYYLIDFLFRFDFLFFDFLFFNFLLFLLVFLLVFLFFDFLLLSRAYVPVTASAIGATGPVDAATAKHGAQTIVYYKLLF
jgi:hypothetical protein